MMNAWRNATSSLEGHLARRSTVDTTTFGLATNVQRNVPVFHHHLNSIEKPFFHTNGPIMTGTVVTDYPGCVQPAKDLNENRGNPDPFRKGIARETDMTLRTGRESSAPSTTTTTTTTTKTLQESMKHTGTSNAIPIPNYQAPPPPPPNSIPESRIPTQPFIPNGLPPPHASYGGQVPSTGFVPLNSFPVQATSPPDSYPYPPLPSISSPKRVREEDSKRDTKRAANRRSAQLSRKRKKAYMEELTKQNKILQQKEAVLNAIPDFVMSFSKKTGNLQYASPSLCRFLNMKASDAENSNIYDFLCPESCNRLRKAINDIEINKDEDKYYMERTNVCLLKTETGLPTVGDFNGSLYKIDEDFIIVCAIRPYALTNGETCSFCNNRRHSNSQNLVTNRPNLPARPDECSSESIAATSVDDGQSSTVSSASSSTCSDNYQEDSLSSGSNGAYFNIDEVDSS